MLLLTRYLNKGLLNHQMRQLFETTGHLRSSATNLLELGSTALLCARAWPLGCVSSNILRSCIFNQLWPIALADSSDDSIDSFLCSATGWSLLSGGAEDLHFFAILFHRAFFGTTISCKKKIISLTGARVLILLYTEANLPHFSGLFFSHTKAT